MSAASPFAPRAGRAFDRWMSAELAQLARETQDCLGDRLEALLLGGGYGRGEGGVVEKDGAQRPYNDLDLFVIVTDPQGVSARLAPVAHRAEARVGVAVDFSHPLTPREIRRWECRLMWHDLLSAHRVLHGAPDALTRLAPARVAGAPPPVEATRLLLNRGAGLLRARRIVQRCEPAPDPDFVRRNAMKALQAAGDAMLIARGAFAATLAARAARLPEVCAGSLREPLLAGYREALGFRFAPRCDEDAEGDAELVERAAAVWCASFLAVEELRHGRAFPDVTHYVAWPGRREPCGWSPRAWARNLAAALARRTFSFDSPHEGLYRELPRLLAALPVPGEWELASARTLEAWVARPA